MRGVWTASDVLAFFGEWAGAGIVLGIGLTVLAAIFERHES